ncbi:energy transducer TonB [soil metagenome]
MSILDQKPKSPLKEGFGIKLGIGLIVALSLSLAAFQIRAPYSKPIAMAPVFADDDEIFTVESIMSHQRETTVEAVKVVKDKPVNIVIDDAKLAQNIKPVAPLNTLSADGSVPDEIIEEAGIPEPTHPIRIPEKMPLFPGGNEALMNYLRQANYCTDAISNGYQGKVYVEFVVDKDGSVKDIKLLNKIFPCLDQAAISHIKRMPKWEPCYQGKKPVAVIMVATFNFAIGGG